MARQLGDSERVVVGLAPPQDSRGCWQLGRVGTPGAWYLRRNPRQA